MVAPSRSVSASHVSSFEAELEGAILQSTASLDHYLQTAAPRWSGASRLEHATPQALHSIYAADMGSSFWHSRSEITCYEDPAASSLCGAYSLRPGPPAGGPRKPPPRPKRCPRTHPLQAPVESRLEAFLQEDVARYMQLREQLDLSASECEAAVLSSTPAERHSRSSSLSFARLPDHRADDEADLDDCDTAATSPVVVAAAAMAAMRGLVGSGAVLPAGFDSAASTAAAAAAVGAGQQQAPAEAGAAAADAAAASPPPPAASSSEEPAAAAAPAPFAMEDDEDIAAQKRAARERLAQLEREDAAAAASSSCAAPAHKCHSKAGAADGCDEPAGAGSVHSTHVPQRPRGWGGGKQLLGADCGGLVDALCNGKEALCLGISPGASLQQARFARSMAAGLVLCTALLPVLWAVQAWGGGAGAGGALAQQLARRAAAWAAAAYLPAAVCALLYCFGTSLLRPPLLHFGSPELERRYVLWSNSSKVMLDALTQALFLAIGGCLWLRLRHGGASGDEAAAAAATRTLLSAASLVGSGLPVLVLLLLRSARYVAWREQLLAGSRLASVVALSLLQVSLPRGCGGGLPLSMPFVALAQLMGIACMQVRLATFVPFQVLHLLVLLLKTQPPHQLLHLAQLFGGGLCLPCLLLHSMELHSRKAFLSTVVAGGAAGGGKLKLV